MPASLAHQWARAARATGVQLAVVSHEALSRGHTAPDTDVLIVDEAHRFRNPETRRYDALARSAQRARVLLVTATPVVNRAADLAHLLRLCLPDHALAPFGVASIAGAVASRDHRSLLRAASAVVVARTPRVLGAAPVLPRPLDGRVLRPPPVAPDTLRRLVRGVDRLTFPDFTDARAARLLRLHLLHRLASSGAAFRQTLRRHLHYLDRATRAAVRGQCLSRATMRVLFGNADEFQLELDDLIGSSTPVADARELAEERSRILALLDLARRPVDSSPKLARLERLLTARRGRRSVVFTAAVSTALEVAGALAWREVVVVGGGMARIASGPLAPAQALALFAPRARQAPPPSTARAASVLVATDLVSEGLDLQDADAIVHFDLPWSPLRLSQRLGRIVRLGSAHRIAHVFWFAPPAVIERHLMLGERLRVKGRVQLALGVTTTSLPGTAQVWNDELEVRERLARDRGIGRGLPVPCHAVVSGPLAAVAAVRWLTPAGAVPHVLAVTGARLEEVVEFSQVSVLLQRLVAAPVSPSPPPPAALAAIRELVRRRLATAMLGPRDGETGQLARAVLRRAREAAGRRALNELAALDGALDRLAAGLRTGAGRALADILERRRPTAALAEWLAAPASMPSGCWEVRLDALLLGDGSTP